MTVWPFFLIRCSTFDFLLIDEGLIKQIYSSSVQLMIFCWKNASHIHYSMIWTAILCSASFSSLKINYSYMPEQWLSYCTWRFNATDFLVRLKGKRLMLVGDSMNRNQFESILCVLREGLQNKSRMYEVHGHKITKGRGYFVFKFEVKVYLACLVSSNFYALITWSAFTLLFSLRFFLYLKMNSTIWEVKTS